ncbi:MAG: hypothetical protein HQL57_07775 [Magnetococcales bacterium]|nr:hypothetical protein [Magnetococcales bacterium]
MDYKQKIAASSLIFKIRRTASALFSGWLDNSGCNDLFHHDAIDDDLIVNDFTECLSIAIDEIKTKSKEQKDIFGWAYGFLCGFVEGALHTKWHFRYVVQRTEEYKYTTFFHSLYKYFDLKPDLLEQVHILYEYYLNQDSEEVLWRSECGVDFGKFDIGDSTQFRDKFLAYMRAESMKRFANILQVKKSDNFCPRVSDYLTQKEIERLLDDCRVL